VDVTISTAGPGVGVAVTRMIVGVLSPPQALSNTSRTSSGQTARRESVSVDRSLTARPSAVRLRPGFVRSCWDPPHPTR